MEINIDKELMIEILEKYYKEQLDFKGKVSIGELLFVRDYYDDECISLNMSIRGNINFMSRDIPASKNITIDTFKDALKYYLAKENYEFEYFEYDYDVDGNSGKRNLNGVKIKIKENNKVYKKGE